MLESGDLLNASADQNAAKKEYLDWCKTNHPNKKADEDVDDDALQIFKNFGSAFFRYSKTENDTLWMFMGFSAVTFHKIDINSVTSSSLYPLVRDCEILEDIITPLKIPSTLANVRKVREYSKFMKENLVSSTSTSSSWSKDEIDTVI